jgi:hypothetical protein
MSAAQGADPKAAPSTPRQPAPGRQDPVNDVVRELRDELGLELNLRDLTYSPSSHNNSISDALYDRVKFLHWRDSAALESVKTECKTAFAEQLNTLTAKRRTEWVLQKLRDVQHDAKWLAQNRILQSPFRTNTALAPRTPSSLQTKLRSLQRVDSGATIQSPTTPTSPGPRKVMANGQHATPVSTRENSPSRRSFQSGAGTTNTSFTTTTSFTANTSFTIDLTNSDEEEDFGSSWTASQVEVPRVGLHRTASGANPHESIAPNLARNTGQTTGKRKRSNDIKDPPATPNKRSREKSPRTPSKAPGLHWQLNNLVQDGLGDNPVTDLHEFWANILADRDDALTCVLRGTISFNNTNKGPLIQTKLDPVRWENKSTRVERRFGSDRFLVLTAPSFTRNLPRHIVGQDQEESRRVAWEEWLGEPKFFMGRQWVIYSIEDIDHDKIKRARSAKNAGGNVPIKEFFLFATKGVGTDEEISTFSFLNWMFPFKENAAQPVCKVAARFTLSTKQSTPSINFKPSQIRWVDDIHANGEEEDITFEDPAFRGAHRKRWDKDEVMTDGCAIMSVGAFRMILESLGILEWPSAIQGRINGAKGMWSPSAAKENKDPYHEAPWIQIRPSQLKMKPRQEDLDDTLCEDNRWCFDVKGYSRPPKVAHLHKDFFSVLEDRGAPSDTMLSVVRDGVHPPIEELRDMTNDAAKAVLWRHRCYPTVGEYQTLDEPGIPRELSRKAELFVDRTGYMPSENLIAADAYERMIEAYLQRIRFQYRFTCPKSTVVYGIADPYGVLKPGEVHFKLSRPLQDEVTEEKFDMFAGDDVLLVRDPTLHGWDIQKVRCIIHRDLAHLENVLVVPSRGQIPLAEKLQGGDYDGDTFWICADARLVKPFMNAPVLEQRGIEFFGIGQEKRTLGEIVSPQIFGTDAHAKAFLKIVLPIALRDKSLGMVTNYCNELSYNRRNGKGLWDPDVRMVADLHDLIIDADKNGYLFGAAEFAQFRYDMRLPKDSMLRKREYDVNVNAAKLRGDADYSDATRLLTILAKRPQHKSDHIMDRVVFDVVNPPFLAYLHDLQKDIVRPAEKRVSDPDLEWLLLQFESGAHPKLPIDLDKEMQALEKPLEQTLKKWGRIWSAEHQDRKPLLKQCVDDYNNIQPVDKDNFYWLMPVAPLAPSPWESFKLAVFARRYYAVKKKPIFWIARDTVCKIKALSESGKRNLDRIREILKPVRPKEWQQANASALSVAQIEEFDYEDDLDDSLFDDL